MWKRMSVVASLLLLSAGIVVAGEPAQYDMMLDGNIWVPGSIIFGDNSVLSSANGLLGTVTGVTASAPLSSSGGKLRT